MNKKTFWMRINKINKIINNVQNKYTDIDIFETDESILLRANKYPGKNVAVAGYSNTKKRVYDHFKFFIEILPNRIEKLCKNRKYVLALNLLSYCYKIDFHDELWDYRLSGYVSDGGREGNLYPEKRTGMPESNLSLNMLKKSLINIFIGLDESEALHDTCTFSNDPIVDSDILEKIIEYNVNRKNTKDAEKFLKYLKQLDPYLDYIKEAESSIKRQEGIQKLMKKNINFEMLNELDGISFEKLIVEQFLKFGFNAKLTSTTGDFGADIIVKTEDETIVAVQCKRFSQKVNLKAVQEVVASLGHYSADFGIVISNNNFLKSAIKLADSNEIELWDGDKLLSFFNGEKNFSQLFEV